MLWITEFKGSSQHDLITKNKTIGPRVESGLAVCAAVPLNVECTEENYCLVNWYSRGKYFHTADIIPYSVMFNSLFISIFQWKNPTINFRVPFITKK